MQQKSLLISLLFLTACNDSSAPHSGDRVRGEFRATEFIMAVGTDTHDVLADGGRLRIRFRGDSTLTGLVHLPNEDSIAFRGAWLERDSIVTMKTDPPTLLEGLDFRHDGRQLNVQETVGGRTFWMTLTKQ